MKFSPTVENPKTTLIVGFVCIFGSLFLWLQNSDIYQHELTEITGTLRKRPVMEHHDSRGGDHYHYDFNLNEYECTFRISNEEYHSLKLDLIKHDIRVGDTISLYIFKDDIRYFHYVTEKIKTYGISKNHQKLYDLKIRNRLIRNDKNALWFFIGFGVIVLLYAFVQNVSIVYWIGGTYFFLWLLFALLFIMP